MFAGIALLVYFFAHSCTLKTERYAHPKRRLIFTTLHAVTFRNIRCCGNVKSKEAQFSSKQLFVYSDLSKF